MKTSRNLAFVAVILAAAASNAMAAGKEVFMNGKSIHGEMATQGSMPSRVVALPEGKPLRLAVNYGETITFQAANGRNFSWTFNGLDRRGVNLASIAPAGFTLVEGSRVSIGINPMMRN